MKKVLMILTMGLFLGTIGYTSVAVANTTDNVECEGDHDKKKCKNKDCKKEECKKEHDCEKKACCSTDKTEAKKACCAKDKAEAKTTEKKSCHKEGEKKSCCAKKAEHK